MQTVPTDMKWHAITALSENGYIVTLQALNDAGNPYYGWSYVFKDANLAIGEDMFFQHVLVQLRGTFGAGQEKEHIISLHAAAEAMVKSIYEYVAMKEHIHQSNLIESVDDPYEGRLSLLAWHYIKAQPRLSRERVMKLHYMLMHNQMSKEDAGHHRKIYVTVGDRAAPEPWLSTHLLSNWLLDMRSWKEHDPIEMHIRFEYIHPFIDGNGRTGRMLLWWHQMKQGSDPTLIRAEEREKYYEWFRR